MRYIILLAALLLLISTAAHPMGETVAEETAVITEPEVGPSDPDPWPDDGETVFDE